MIKENPFEEKVRMHYRLFRLPYVLFVISDYIPKISRWLATDIWFFRFMVLLQITNFSLNLFWHSLFRSHTYIYATLVNTRSSNFCKCVGFDSQNPSNLIASYSSKRPVYRLLYSFCLLFNKTDLIAPSFQIHILNVH